MLAESYALVASPDPGGNAALVAMHLMQGEPVPDRAALERLGRLIGWLQAHFLTNRVVDDASLAMIRWESALRWGRVVRTALKAGTIGLADAMAVRPDHLGLGYSSLDELVAARLVGTARGTAKRSRAARPVIAAYRA